MINVNQIKLTYKYFILFFSAGFLFSQNLGFVVDGTSGNYTSSVVEATDGTFTGLSTPDRYRLQIINSLKLFWD